VAEGFYGREELVDAVARSEAPLTLLTGDSGIGKTRVLEAAAGPRPGWINSKPRWFAASSGAVQQGVLSALGDVVATVATERGSVAELGDRLADAAERMLMENVRELGLVIGAELLEIVRSRLGPQFGKALSRYVSKLSEQVDESLAVRLAAAADESTATVLAMFAAEVVAVAEDRRIALYFDVGERLNDEEIRILADLAERIPHGCHVRVAFATFGGDSVARVAELRLLAPAIHEIEVLPLDESDVEAWLTDTGTDVPVGRVMKATGGYPLHIGDLIQDVEKGATVNDLPLNEQVARRVEAAWQELPVEAAGVARSLSVLEEPLPEAKLRELVALEAGPFAQAIDILVRARIFPTRVNGQPWFHEQRRSYVRRKLTLDELDEASTRAAEAVWDQLRETLDPRYATQFADLAANASTLRSSDEKLDAVLGLDVAEHAAMAALIELMTPGNRGAAEADQLFRNARRFTDIALDPLAVLAKLEEVGLVVTASNDYSTAVVPILTARAIAAIEGRAYRNLNRSPVPELASLVLQIGVRPHLGEFTQARFGIGRPSIGGLARTAGGGDPEPGFGALSPDRRNPGTHLLCRGSYADRPLWLVASYDSLEAREEARQELEAVDTEIFGGRLRVGEVFDHPSRVVPEQRFANAAARAAGLGPSGVPPTGDIKVPLVEDLDRLRHHELRVETAMALRALAGDIERAAMDLDEPFALYWDEGEQTRIDCTVYGGEEKAIRVPGLADVGLGESRYAFFEIEQLLELGASERLQNVTRGVGRGQQGDPVFAEIARRRNRAFAFNSAQPPRAVALEPVVLEELIRGGFLRVMADARVLATVMPREPAPLPPTALHVYVVLENPLSGWKPGCAAEVIAAESESKSGEDEVYFGLSRSGVDVTGFFPRVTDDAAARFESAYGFSPSPSGPSHSWMMFGDLDMLLRDYAGFHEDDLAPHWPS
jgi:hypothetical protein